MKIWVFDDMSLCTEQEVKRILPLVSAQRREQALRYKHTLGQFCCLKSWLMLYDLLDERMKGFMEKWEYNEHGKPSFTPSLLHAFTPYFSISHCKKGIAVAIDDQPIGMDIEAIRHADKELIERTMNEEEIRTIANANANADRAFTRLWTQKEAIVKAQGVGIQSFEQLQGIRAQDSGFKIRTVEKDNYIYSIAYK